MTPEGWAGANASTAFKRDASFSPSCGARFSYTDGMPTLRQLAYLVSIADLKHFGRAAQANRISQPTLSQQLRTLERKLGVTLVERRLRRAELTPIGREVCERARRLLEQYREIEQVARRSGKDAEGSIRLGITPTLGPYLLPDLIAALQADQPGLKLFVQEGIPDEQIVDLAQGRLDMLLGPLPLAGDGISVEPLFRERLFLIAPQHHPLATAQEICGEELRGLDMLSLDQRHHLHRQTEDVCERRGMRLRQDYAGTSLDGVRQMVASGLGLAMLPEIYIRSEVGGSDGVRVLNVSGWNEWRSIAAAWRSNATFAPIYLQFARRLQRRAMRSIMDD